MRDLEQAARPRECLRAEVRPDAIADHRDAIEDRDAQQIVDLLRREELRLVEQQAGHVAAARELDRRAVLLEQSVRVVVRAHEIVDLTHDAETRVDLTPRLRVDPRLRQEDPVLALLVVVRGLEERRRLAGVHRSVAEVQLGHGVDSPIGAHLTTALLSVPLPTDVRAALALGARCGKDGSHARRRTYAHP